MHSKPTGPDEEHLQLDGVRIKRVVPVARWISGEALGIAGTGYHVHGTAEYDEATGRFVLRRVVVDAEDGSEVTGEGLRAVQVGDILREALRAYSGSPDIDLERLAELGASGPTTETLRAVAMVYRLALMVGDAPTQRVAERFGVPRSTAGRWVTRSRDRGFLTVMDPRSSRTAEGAPRGGVDGQR